MAIAFFKTKWEAGDLSLEAFFRRCKKDGFDGVETVLADLKESPAEIRDLCAGHRLRLIGHVITPGKTPEDDRASLERQVKLAVDCGAEMMNCHLGSDFFSREENIGLFARAGELSRETGVPVTQETHRGRALYNLPDILRYLEALPDLELTADISHLMCVHESDLSSRWELLEKMAPRCRHVHARVGFAEGPQVPHPMAPEWAGLCGIYLKFWKMIAKARGGNLTVTPEAGPPPYMHVVPFTQAPLADAWQVNVAVRDWLKKEM